VGIGLLIVKEFTEQNNGQLVVTSEEGKGTTFSITFPAFIAP
jgi:signal transduction histidine kinase